VKVLKKSFYQKDPKEVAKSLLGKILVRRLGDKQLKAVIVETEAYYGREDPASRAALGAPKYCVEMLYGDIAKALVYMVHANWLFNIVAHEPGKAGAVLIRAVRPIEGIEEMTKHRKAKNVFDLTNGPGKLTRALAIDRSLNGVDVTSQESEVFFCEGIHSFKIASSHRIGVRKDLKEKLRFFIAEDPFVSR